MKDLTDIELRAIAYLYNSYMRANSPSPEYLSMEKGPEKDRKAKEYHEAWKECAENGCKYTRMNFDNQVAYMKETYRIKNLKESELKHPSQRKDLYTNAKSNYEKRLKFI